MNLKNTLLKKVILLFVITLIPLIIVSSWYLHRNNTQQQVQTLSAIQTTTDTHISYLEEHLKQIYSANLHMIEQKFVRDLAVTFSDLPLYDRSAKLKFLREQLGNICVSSSFLDSAHVYFFDAYKVYNSVQYKFGSYDTLNQTEMQYYQSLSTPSGMIQYYVDPLTQEQKLSFFMAPISGNTSYAVNLVLSQDALKNYLDSNTTYQDDYYLFHMQNDFTLSSLPPEFSLDALHILENDQELSEIAAQTVVLNGKSFFAFPVQTTYSNGTYIRFIAASSLAQSVYYSYYLQVVFLLLIIISCIFFFTGIYQMVHKPLNKLTNAFDEVKKGNFQIQILQDGNGDFSYLFQAFNDMAIKLDHLIERDYNQKMLLQKAELRQLQAQINPHFLYNSFFMLQRMIHYEPDEAQNVANALASCFRYITKNSMENVSLLEEYEHAKHYAYIQGLRFSGRIDIELAPLPEDFYNLLVPKLILQPILENAFQYGLNNKISNGLICVQFLAKENLITIRIEDNGDELSEEKLLKLLECLSIVSLSTNGVEMSGILNIQRRLLIFSDYKDSLRVFRSPLGGLCVEIQLQQKQRLELL